MRRLTWQISILVSVPEVECNKPPTMSTNWSHASDRTLHNMMRLLRQSLSTRLIRLDSPPPFWAVFTKRNRASIDMQASETISTPELMFNVDVKSCQQILPKNHKICIFDLNLAIKSQSFFFILHVFPKWGLKKTLALPSTWCISLTQFEASRVRRSVPLATTCIFLL